MKAVVHNVYGDADVLHIDEVPKPTVKPNQVLVRVRAAGVDRGAWHMMTGLPLVARLGLGLRAPRNRIPGLDLAGVVEAVGEQVTDFAVGDEVFGEGSSSWAEYARAKPGRLLHKPAHLSFEQAAAIPTSGATALHMLTPKSTQSTREVLVIGAGGGVGSFTVILARSQGDHVTAVCSTAKIDAVRRFGADRVIDYTSEPLTGSYDLIVDIGGNRPLSTLRALLKPTGTLSLAGGENGGRFFGGLERSLQAFATTPFIKQKLRAPIVIAGRDDLAALTDIESPLGSTYPLSEAATAMRELAAGRITGKTVLTMPADTD
ncbi:NAD(P)-dependent alcohol dehydrogenase [Paractinoplanes brasiliensis]|uniref:NADPH:quinone reductase-like Zn-dependent oxidoreductase n=1 Tax=Paractinoplanes brasiliensis TaxID=52695 RepID=A0A4R6J7P8_9ACTN|nr:NAD(P)-dependent alcohol dehydrogenase [Actinoplanes brasiliensis]TDO31573.1 NADPH:quinone reductase-like Zn-dependent oxidoreductase [Actinoplanes brasiliensis]GID30972.1 NADPH:quinone reductase [Actinoplanes brasiliensis]